ncbi:unnamed protein product [Orchesella dallaii]|uniref:RNA-directed DNA polymerase n=1 Tax=Orchesella dallaii TaxID=48710 RepID=A0ABP1RRP5_9HEXA
MVRTRHQILRQALPIPQQNVAARRDRMEERAEKPKLQLQMPTPFSFEPKDWPQWKRRFSHYHLLSKLNKEEPEYQVHALVYAMGERADEILASLNITEDEKKDYDVVLEAFEQHFVGSRNVIYERALFGSRTQQEGESIEELVTALHTMSEYCAYGNIREELVRDRIVLGVKHKKLAEKLMLNSELTLSKAVEIARQWESVMRKQSKLRPETVEHVDFTSKRDDSRKEPFMKNRERYHPYGGTGARSNDHDDENRRQASAAEFNQRSGCGNCGSSEHKSRDKDKCKAKDIECFRCKRLGHYAKFCRSKRNLNEVRASKPRTSPPRTAFLYEVNRANWQNRQKRWTAQVKVERTTIHFKLDTGADVTVLPFALYQRYFRRHSLKPPSVQLMGPSNGSLSTVGTFEVKLQHNNQELIETIYVEKGLQRPLLGLRACEELKLVQRLERINSQTSKTEVDARKEFPSLFDGLGLMEQPYHIRLKPGAEPYALQVPRRVPLPLMSQLKKQLQEMVEKGVIAPVEEPTEWCAPIIMAGKPDGSIRICVDLSRLNQSVERELHPMPVVEHELAQLNGAKIFSKPDANSGFWQIPLTRESSKLTTFITPFGRYYFKRLPFGISSAPEHFQKRMTQILVGIDGVICHMDDILVFASTQEEHDTTLRHVLQRLENSGITLNKEKCIFGVESVRFLGHMIDSNGIRADESKVEAIMQMKPPTNVTEVQRFLGMVNYLGRFVPNLAEISQPINQLRSDKADFVWEAPQQQSFLKIKEALSSDQVLASYDVSKETVVSSDASSYGVGAVLKQKQMDGTWRPVSYASRTLSKTEQGYAQIEKEALGITWACERFRDLIYGKQFRIETDHKPLVPIFTTKDLNDLTRRLQRFRMRMMHYSYEIFYTPGKQLITADTLSCQPITRHTTSDKELQQEIECHVQEVVSHLPTTNRRLTAIAIGQQEDSVLREVASFTTTGLPNQQKVRSELRRYYEVRDEIAVENGLLMRGCRIIIPPALRESILQRLHEGHQGISKCRARARETVWWPGISEQVAEMIKRCQRCIEHLPAQHQPLLQTELPERPWQKVAMDLFYNEDHWYLVCVDFFSRYPEVSLLRKLSSAAVVEHCKAIFARHGLPEVVFSDNGPQFSPYASSEFKRFVAEYGFSHQTSSPRYPQANGLAEATVKIIKLQMKKNDDSVLALMEYRTTPLTNGYSPTELLTGRKIRTTLPCAPGSLSPKIVDLENLQRKEETNKKNQKQHYDRRHRAVEKPELSPGEKVWIKDDDGEK